MIPSPSTATHGAVARRASVAAALTVLAWSALVVAAPARANPPPRVLFTGDVMGSFEPCDCDGQPFGGLAQRAFVVGEQRDTGSPPLVLDAGNLLFRSLVALGPDAMAWRKTAAVLMVDAYGVMDVDAVNVGPHDLTAGLEYLQRLQIRAAFPFLSSNLVHPDSGEPLFVPALALDREGEQVVVLGLLPGEIAGRGYVTADPVQTARDRVAEARANGADLVLLMSSLGMADSRKLARKVRGIDVVLVSGERNHSDPPQRVRDTLLVASGSRGKFVAEIVAPTDGSPASARFIPVEKHGPVHEVIDELVAETRARYESPDFEEAGPEAVP